MTKMRYFLPMAHKILMLVYPDFELLDASGPSSVFRAANHALFRMGRPPAYDIQMASATGGSVVSNSGVEVQTRALATFVTENIHTLLIVGAEEGPITTAMRDLTLHRYVPQIARAATRFGSVCTGVFVLAALNLLEKKRVTTHWDACAPLAKAFPKLTVDADALYVVDGEVWTSAGVSTGIDMALA
ncbi:MAG TPA: AraC family transcriptional regulator, partial [Steroidobacteraceae bacterium]|nr:AraC family transcriptional regulator [Steroidobacteraceae bacterium]